MAASAGSQVATREVMDIRQAADYLGISGDTLYRYASEGFVPAFISAIRHAPIHERKPVRKAR